MVLAPVMRRRGTWHPMPTSVSRARPCVREARMPGQGLLNPSAKVCAWPTGPPTGGHSFLPSRHGLLTAHLGLLGRRSAAGVQRAGGLAVSWEWLLDEGGRGQELRAARRRNQQSFGAEQLG